MSDSDIRQRMAGYFAESKLNISQQTDSKVVPAIPPTDNKHGISANTNENQIVRCTTHPPTPKESQLVSQISANDSVPKPPQETMSREEIRFLADVAARPLSTTVSRYQRLHLSRRRGNAIRQSLAKAGIIETVPIATRSGQVMLYQLSDHGRSVCADIGIDPGPTPRASLEHRYWTRKVAESFEKNGYEVSVEHPIPGDGTIDLLAERPGEKVAVEVETGKSDIKANLDKLRNEGFDRLVVVATSPAAVSVCHRALTSAGLEKVPSVEVMTWLDVG